MCKSPIYVGLDEHAYSSVPGRSERRCQVERRSSYVRSEPEWVWDVFIRRMRVRCHMSCCDFKGNEEIYKRRSRAGVRQRWGHSEWVCYNVKLSEEVNMCASRAGERDVRSFGGSVFVVLLWSNRVRACHGSRKSKLRKIILYWTRGTQKEMRSLDSLAKIDYSAMSHHVTRS